MADKIYWPYIYLCEDGPGGRKLVAYWPGANSGVSVADGMDLGQLENSIFNALTEPLKDKLLPYLGLRGLAAHKALLLHPLTLTDAECEELEAPKRAVMTASLSIHYDRDSAGPRFGDIPAGPQTAMMSVHWQYGALWVATPRFWTTCCRQDWKGAIAELRDFHDAYPTRRNRDADYLEAHL